MCDDDARIEGKQDPWGLEVVCLFFGLCLALAVFLPPSTSQHGFTSDAVRTINDRGDIDCGGSSLRVILRGPRVPIPPGDLARRAEKACRDDAVEHIWSSVIGLVLVTAAGIRLFAWARRHQARRRTNGPGNSCGRTVSDVPLLETGPSFAPIDRCSAAMNAWTTRGTSTRRLL